MNQPDHDGPAFLSEDDSVAWFRRTKHGPEILDYHTTILRSAFVSGVDIHYRAAVDPVRGEPQTLLVTVKPEGMSEEQVWESLLVAQGEIMERSERLRGLFPPGLSPSYRIAVTIESSDSEWEQLRQELGE